MPIYVSLCVNIHVYRDIRRGDFRSCGKKKTHHLGIQERSISEGRMFDVPILFWPIKWTNTQTLWQNMHFLKPLFSFQKKRNLEELGNCPVCMGPNYSIKVCLLYVCFEKWFTRRWIEVSSGDSTFKNMLATWVNIISATYVHTNRLLSYLLTVVVFIYNLWELIQSAIWPYGRKTKKQKYYAHHRYIEMQHCPSIQRYKKLCLSYKKCLWMFVSRTKI